MTARDKIKVMAPHTASYTPVHEVPDLRLDANAKRSPEKQEEKIPEDYLRRLRAAYPHIQKFKTNFTFSALQKDARRQKDTLKKLEAEIAKMQRDDYNIQAASAIFYTADDIPLFVYLGRRSGDMTGGDTKLPLKDQDMHERLLQTIDGKDSVFRAQEAQRQADKAEQLKTARREKRRRTRASHSGKNPRKAAKIDEGFSQHNDEDEIDREEEVQVFYDGLQPNMVERYYETVHSLCAFNPPDDDTTAKRHGVSEDGFRHTFDLEAGVQWTENLKDSGEKVYSKDGGVSGVEPAGVMHLVEAWHQRGNINKGLYMSTFLSGAGQAIQATRHYYEANFTLERCIESAVQVFFPDLYPVLAHVREAGRAFQSSREGGVYLGRAVVYKLQLFNHIDQKDCGISASFPAGHFVGGYLLIPQLGAKFLYAPGDVAIFYASLLFHTVTPWEAKPMKATDVVTPGRVGTVMFNPEGAVDVLKDKPKGWGMSTVFGKLPSSKPCRLEEEEVDEEEGYESEEPTVPNRHS
ncbi:hypothetical protein AAF712_012030 [Marasmius tenuissimus]|uniref:Uncharacterized protein n=1 Tax=Marasmius tenuissimus TaxID=585030 RepID=A0ABR2ZIV8_9AGAR